MWQYGRVGELSGDVEVLDVLDCWGYCVVRYIVRMFGILNIEVLLDVMCCHC
jgi:hypothetical protein